MKEPRGMDARSLDYVLGVEDCAMMVYDYLEDNNSRQLKEAIMSLLDNAKTLRSQRFMEENGLLD
ncbi:hypothetical protein [Methanomassiliicoccus luminyensis]|uniref:hypothetical protein n=1 Tax=Methanomassiliicoccus luminyensis TaxID=1080712 RepID=UPI000375A0CE|nr:hypothetical protein [Methanomassiliicoccus luminyensis]